MSTAVTWRTRPEAGSMAGMRFLLFIANTLGRHALHGLLYPIALYFFLVRGAERHASRAFLTRALGRPASLWESYRHFLKFSQVTADRIFLLTNPTCVPVSFVGSEQLQTLVDQKRGGIFLAAHLGSFEAARVIGPQLGGVRLRIVLDVENNGQLMTLLSELNPEFASLILDSGGRSMDLGLKIADAVKRGEWVGILADRYRPGDKTLSCQFMGDTARLPMGPFVLATTLKVPVVMIFPRCTDDGYEVHCETLSEGASIARSERTKVIDTLAQTFAQRLAYHARSTPWSWFNFFDFWH